MSESFLSLRMRNAQLERALVSEPARRACRRIRTELARRGLTCAQRETILHDNLLVLSECEAAGGDPVGALLGTSNVSECEAAVHAFCDNVAAECPRLPVALTVIRFFAFMLVAFSVVFAAHLAYRMAHVPPGGWLPFYLINLRTVDYNMIMFTLTVVPVLFLLAQIVSSLIPRNPFPHALPAVATPLLYAGMLPLVQPILTTLDGPWVNANRFVLVVLVLAMAAAGLAIIYLIERRNPRA